MKSLCSTCHYQGGVQILYPTSLSKAKPLLNVELSSTDIGGTLKTQNSMLCNMQIVTHLLTNRYEQEDKYVLASSLYLWAYIIDHLESAWTDERCCFSYWNFTGMWWSIELTGGYEFVRFYWNCILQEMLARTLYEDIKSGDNESRKNALAKLATASEVWKVLRCLL